METAFKRVFEYFNTLCSLNLCVSTVYAKIVAIFRLCLNNCGLYQNAITAATKCINISASSSALSTMWRINGSSPFVGVVGLVYFGRRIDPQYQHSTAATLSFHNIKKLNDIKISRARTHTHPKMHFVCKYKFSLCFIGIHGRVVSDNYMCSIRGVQCCTRH